MKICIDAGHGGTDGGCNGFGKLEKNLNLQYAQALKLELEKYGNQIIMTRNDDRDLSLNDRCKINNDNNCELFISCHLNAFNALARGTEVIHSIFADSNFISLCKKIGSNINIGINVPLRRIFSRKSENGSGKDYYGVIRGTKCKAIIIEPLFLDNQVDALVVFQDGWHVKLAKIISDTIANHYGMQCKTTYKTATEILKEISDSSQVWEKILSENKDHAQFKHLGLLLQKAYYHKKVL